MKFIWSTKCYPLIIGRNKDIKPELQIDSLHEETKECKRRSSKHLYRMLNNKCNPNGFLKYELRGKRSVGIPRRRCSGAGKLKGLTHIKA